MSRRARSRQDATDALDSIAGSGRTTPVALRTCVGCRGRAARSDLLRTVVVDVAGLASVVPDPRGRLPGRGASLHPVPECLDLAERRRAFPRAFRRPGPLDTTPLRAYVRAQAADPSPGAQSRPSDEEPRQR